jgi:putative CocE/NonD family hydrolase
VWGARIPARDGVKLNATIYRPRGATGKLPTIFTFTPYVGDSYHDRAMYFARNGYAYALVDVRGRGNSEGRFEPFANEARDGYDVVEWLAAQPWSDGKVAMWGGSYAGFDQWATLKEAPPHLTTIVPAAAAYPGYDFPIFNNVFSTYFIQWLTYTSGATPNSKLFNEGSLWTEVFSDLYTQHVPYERLDRVAGNMSTTFRLALAHPTPDAYWDAMTPTPDQYRRMNVPILTITGHYDGDQPGALHYYRQFMEYASPEARAKHFLVVGPWDHAGTRTPNAQVGGLTFGPASVLDLNALHKAWYDWTMKGGPKPEFLKSPVAYYVTGANEGWRYADALDRVATSTRTLYLASEDGRADDPFRSGALVDAKPAGASKPDAFVYDPLDVSPLELQRAAGPSYLTDQTDVMNLGGNGAVYHSAPFAADVELSGPVRLTAWIALDVPDTDLAVSVYEILRDGSSVLLTSDLKRARYRESLREAKPVPPGEAIAYRFDTFTWVSRRIARGSRLRLVVSCPNTMALEKNYNSGKPVASETAADARTAHVTLFHDAARPSALELPVAVP